ncbi:MAG TPA: sigma-70 family RNA polymerase sigma factor [Dehalococcoidales bacterium]|nr:sigma-70 family RNA polymerase sigma factor [Dehalococcoidales bacterium]
MSLLFIILMAGRTAKNTVEAFTAFYQQFLPKVFKYVSYRVTDRSLAEDITSTVFEKALAKFNQYNEEKAALSTWVFSIARNTITDHFRASAREHNVPLEAAEDKPAGGLSPEQQAETSEECRILHSCIKKLSAPEQEIVSLKFSAEMTNRQIAGVLGLSESNVGVILYRAVRKLRKDFGGLGHA